MLICYFLLLLQKFKLAKGIDGLDGCNGTDGQQGIPGTPGNLYISYLSNSVLSINIIFIFKN